ncbi:MAG TPA: tRNA (adenosine(37)-N6)-threonylcarbamoyltransferase complex ATPase subunit type 1 TsaE [Burkholderiaceae bacterium]|nr:tRNA (adenosine(37)-N6)-threonylcarbamoyltransferase complex ATPase subunit type 1 TsaE [Burkholderiaceae bacterium]
MLADETATAALAGWAARRLQPGTRIHLSGDLGAGKTTFTRTVLSTLGHTGRVRSPTFTLMEPYNLSSFDVYHFDFYRFSSKDEWRDAGFDEPIGSDAAVAIVEWPEMAGDDLPPPDLHLRLSFVDDGSHGGDGRRVDLRAGTAKGRAWLNDLRETVAAGRLAGISCATA